MGFPGGSDSKESAWNAGDLGSITGKIRRIQTPEVFICHSKDIGFFFLKFTKSSKSSKWDRRGSNLIRAVFKMPLWLWCGEQISGKQ